MTTKSRAPAFAVVVLMGGIACGNSGFQKSEDPITAATGDTGQDLVAFRRQLAQVKAFDAQLAARFDISVAKAKSEATPDLVIDFLRSGLWVDMTIYDNPNVGIYRLSQTSPSLAELLKRSDYARGLIKAYAEFNVDPKRNPNYERNSGSVGLGLIANLIGYPPKFSAFKDHEKELLAALCKQYHAMSRVNSSYAQNKRPYSFWDFPIELAFALQRQMGVQLPQGVGVDSKTKKVHVDKMPYASIDEAVSHFESLSK